MSPSLSETFGTERGARQRRLSFWKTVASGTFGVIRVNAATAELAARVMRARLAGLTSAKVSTAWRNLIAVVAMGCLTPGYSQVARDIPNNAHYSAGEQGWLCNAGFTQLGGLCMQDSAMLPSESAFEYFDGQWRCRAGYHRSGMFCTAGVAPAHASFVGDGDRWQCEWGFQKVGAECQEIKAPPHGYIESSGQDWACYPGFTRKADRCEPTPKPPQPDEVTSRPP